MSTSNEHDPAGMPARTIHTAYREALQARREYKQAVGGPFEPNAHEQLHDAVASYYEVLRPLVSSSNSTEDRWENEELWPTQPMYVTAALCPACGANQPVDDLEEIDLSLGDPCPSCGNAVVERADIPKTDDKGQVVYDHVEGLNSLDGVWDKQIEKEVPYDDALGSHSETVIETQLLNPAHLQQVARALDEALERLALHAEVDDEAPTTELDNEDLEKFGEQLQQIREQYSDEDGIDSKEVADDA